MSFETSNTDQNKKEMKSSLYRERAFSSIDREIEKLAKIRKGEVLPLKLSEQEKENIVSFENELGKELEKIFKIKVNSAIIYPEYLLDNKGRAIFRSFAGFDIEAEDMESVEKFLYSQRGKISSLSGIQRKKMEGQLKKVSEDTLFEGIKSKMLSDGEIDLEGVEEPKVVSFLINPENALDKIKQLRIFKRKIKEVLIDSFSDETDNEKRVKQTILNQYKRRVNELIVEQFENVVKVKMVADKVGIENLSQAEQELLKQFSGMDKFVSVYEKFDKFMFGAERESDKEGNRRQLGKEMEQYMQDLEQKYIENEKLKRQKAKEKNLDFDKLTKKNVPKEIFAENANAFLDFYGQKSAQPAEEFDPDRKGSASDNKWQFVASDRYSSMDVEPKQNVIKAPARNRSAEELICSLLGHEFTHFIQTINQRKIELKLFNEICGDRRLVLAEGGAMMMQDKVSEELFGYNVLPKVFYSKAMLEKLRGGNYLDCVRAYYKSSLKVYKETSGQVSEDVFKENAKNLLETAMRSAKRLFKTGALGRDSGNLLSKSKDTVYLEQFIVVQRLKEAGLEKFSMVRGVSLESLTELLEAGLLNEADIETLNLDFIRSIWEREKHKYLLDDSKQEKSDEEKLAEVREAIRES